MEIATSNSWGLQFCVTDVVMDHIRELVHIHDQLQTESTVGSITT